AAPPPAACAPPRPPPAAGAAPPPRPPRAAGAGAFGSRAVPWMYPKSVRAGSAGTRPSGVGDVFEKMYMMFVCGSSEPPCQFAPPVADGMISVASGFGHVLTTGGVKIGPIL